MGFRRLLLFLVALVALPAISFANVIPAAKFSQLREDKTPYICNRTSEFVFYADGTDVGWGVGWNHLEPQACTALNANTYVTAYDLKGKHWGGDGQITLYPFDTKNPDAPAWGPCDEGQACKTVSAQHVNAGDVFNITGYGIQKCDSCSMFGDPINTVNGSVTEKVTDYKSNTVFPLVFKRFYSSNSAQSGDKGTLGYGWGDNYNPSITDYSASGGGFALPALTFHFADGSGGVFLKMGSSWVATIPINGTLSGSQLEGWVFTKADGRKEYFNSRGHLTKIINRKGLVQTVSRNGDGLVTKVTGPFGRTLSFTYDNLDRITSVTTPAGNTFQYAYDNGNLIKVSYPDGTSIQYQYNDSKHPHSLTAQIDQEGNLAQSWSYDSEGYATSSEGSGGVNKVTVQNWKKGSNTVGYQNAEGGQVTQNVSDEHGRLMPSSQETSYGTTNYVYDENGMLSGIINGNKQGQALNYSPSGLLEDYKVIPDASDPSKYSSEIGFNWNSKFRLPTQVFVNGKLTRNFTYNDYGSLTKEVDKDASGQERDTVYTYGNNDLLSTIQLPGRTSSQVISYSHDGQGNVATVTNQLGQVTKYPTYTPDGLVSEMVDPNGNHYSYGYDKLDRITSVTYPNGGKLVYAYTPDGQVKKVTYPDGVYYEYAYNKANQLTSIKDAKGNKIQFTRDLLGKPTEVEMVNASGSTTYKHQYKYDHYGNVTESIAPNGDSVQYGYDSSGRLSSVKYANGSEKEIVNGPNNKPSQITNALDGITKISYTTVGDIDSVTDPRGLKTTYKRNGFGNVISKTSPDTGTTSFTYNNAGELSGVTDASGNKVTYTYDALGRKTKATYSDGLVVSYTYDQGSNGVGHLTDVSTNKGVTTQFGYDNMGNVVTKKQAISAVSTQASFSYNAANTLTGLTYPDGVKVQFALNSDGKITSVSANGNTLASDITYMPFGPMKGLTFGNGAALTRTYNESYQLINQTVSGALDNSYVYDSNNNLTQFTDNLNTDDSKTYQYDALNRLTNLKSALGDYSYSYDADGNRTKKSSLKGTYGYSYAGDSNHLLEVNGPQGGDSVEYDTDGRITQLGSQNFVYNAKGELTEVTDNGAVVANYLYNGLGERIQSTVADPKTQDSITTTFFYGPQGKLLEAKVGGKTTTVLDFVYLNNEPLAELINGKPYYFVNSTTGTPSYLLDQNKTQSWTFDASPFGVMANQVSEAVQPLRFPGQYESTGTGLSYNKARDYSPLLGRYIEPDPLGLSSGSLNNYVYVGNNPINYIDPMGQSFWHDVLTGGLIAGLAVPGADVADAGALAADLSAEAMTGDEAATVATESPEAVAEDTGATKSQICPQDVKVQRKGWKLGEDVYKPTYRGNDPSWSSVRRRFWRNEANFPSTDYEWTNEQLERMDRGLAPQRYNADKKGLESMELSHEPIPAREGGKSFVPRWPQEHADIDEFRHPGY